MHLMYWVDTTHKKNNLLFIVKKSLLKLLTLFDNKNKVNKIVDTKVYAQIENFYRDFKYYFDCVIK